MIESVIIDGLVVDAWLQASILLAREEEARGHSRGGRTNKLLLESLLDVILHRLALRDGQGVYSTLREYSSRQQVNGTIPWPVRCYYSI